jgi:hypothetical protein
MTTTTYTEQGIKARARAYNAAYPEAAAEIDAGEAQVLVLANSDSRTGWHLHVTVTPGVRATDGGWIAAADPVAFTLTARDGRLTPQDNARRTLAGRFTNVHVPINYR